MGARSRPSGEIADPPATSHHTVPRTDSALPSN